MSNALGQRLTMPGNLAVSIAWRDKPTTLRSVAGGDRMAIFQDGKLLAELEATASLTSGLPAATTIQWGRGVYARQSSSPKNVCIRRLLRCVITPARPECQ